MYSFQHKVKNEVGLHARPASQLQNLIKKLGCTVTIAYNGRKVNASRMLQVVSLGAVTGAVLDISISNAESSDVYSVIQEFFDRNV